MINKYGVGISPDAMEFGMTHGPFDFELDALAVENPMEGREEDQGQYYAYIVGFEDNEEDPAGPLAHTLMYIWDRDHWKRIFPRVVHCERELGPFEYIGRGSKWGNPFKIGAHGNREEVIMKYADWLLTQPQLLDALPELRGKNLGCYCAPEPCHGDILLELANTPEPRPSSVISDKDRQEIPWEFGKYWPDDDDRLVRANECERYWWLTRDGVGRGEVEIFNAAFIRGIAWGLHKAARIAQKTMVPGSDWPGDDDIPF